MLLVANTNFCNEKLNKIKRASDKHIIWGNLNLHKYVFDALNDQIPPNKIYSC